MTLTPKPTRRLGRSRPNTGSGYTGTIPPDIWDTLRHVWSECPRCSSNFSREHAPEVAFLASLGWISTIAPDGLDYRRDWRVTAEGLFALEHRALYET